MTSFSRIVAELGPQFIARELERARELNDADRVAFFKHVAPEIMNGLTDGLRAFEVTKERESKALWVADTAAHMLIHHQGDVMDGDVDNAVRLAKRIADEAERICR